jgi:hypothetical protein
MPAPLCWTGLCWFLLVCHSVADLYVREVRAAVVQVVGLHGCSPAWTCRVPCADVCSRWRASCRSAAEEWQEQTAARDHHTCTQFIQGWLSDDCSHIHTFPKRGPKGLAKPVETPVECCESGCANTTVPGELGRQVINPHMQRSVLGTANSWPYNCWTATAYSSELFIPSGQHRRNVGDMCMDPHTS